MHCRLAKQLKMGLAYSLFSVLISCGGSGAGTTPPPTNQEDNGTDNEVVNRAPTISTFTSKYTENNFAVVFEWQVADIDNDALTCQLQTAMSAAKIEITQCQSLLNYTFTYSEVGVYNATLIVSDGQLETEKQITVNVVAPEPEFTLSQGQQADFDIYVKGGFNNWSNTDAMTFNNGIYVFEWSNPLSSQELKIASANWDKLNCGSFNLTTNGAAENATCSNAGNATINFDGLGTYRLGFSYQPDGQSQVQLLKSEPKPIDESGLGQAGTVSIHYLHSSLSYQGWGLHLWGEAIDQKLATSWQAPRLASRIEDDYAVYDVPIENANKVFNFIMHYDDFKSSDGDLAFTPATLGTHIWLVEGDNTLYTDEVSARNRFNTLVASLGKQSQFLDLSQISISNTQSSMPNDWTKSAQFAQVFVRAYQDSDGDGIGDIQGLISRLDYLQNNGVNGIWLMPMMESSDNDHGYATTDYRSIEQDYGSLDDFKALLTQAHQRGIAIVMDYVINHSSNDNPLFKDAMSSATNDKRDWYIIEQTKPQGWHLWGNDPWTQSPQGAYYSAFTSSMPDFDLTNPDVLAYHQSNLRFWLNLGVDGFRFDAVGVLVENGKDGLEDQAQNHQVMKALKDVILAYDNRYIVCESPSGFRDFANDNSCERAFNFSAGHDIIASVKAKALNQNLVNELTASNIDSMPLILANHDLFAGNRVWEQFSGDEEQYKLAAATYLLASANPFTYYGEEIGMAANNMQGDHSIRAPMSWTNNSTHAGFSSTTPFKTLASNSVTHNVDAAQSNTDSLLAFYRQLYQLRQQHSVIATGDLVVPSQAGDKVLVLVRSNNTEQVVILINYSDQQQAVNVNGLTQSAVATRLLGDGDNESTNSNGQLSTNIAAQSVVVFKVQNI
ncbi:alpha-amylase family glycosyl hydrolase [Saccharobesus litoralis]|nr:alpha-amylase family glycosyl hydrolase [Saccharobesus litoralis]